MLLRRDSGRSEPGLLRRKSSRLIRIIANPNELLSAMLPQSERHESNSKKTDDWRFSRNVGGGYSDLNAGEPDRLKSLSTQSPLFVVAINASIEDKLPRGYRIRSLQKADYDRGYTDLKNIGYMPRADWDEHCRHLLTNNHTYTILVITDSTQTVVCTGTLLLERTLVNGGGVTGHIKDLSVAAGQKRNHLGLRMLEQLDLLACEAGCTRSVVITPEINEAFYQQKGFQRTPQLEMIKDYSQTFHIGESIRQHSNGDCARRSILSLKAPAFDIITRTSTNPTDRA